MNDDDLTIAATPNVEVKGAAACFAIGGLFLVLTGVQILGLRWYASWMNLGKWAFFALGALTFVLGLRIFRGDARANAIGVGVAGIDALFGAGWFVLTFGAILSLMNVLAVVVCALAAVLAIFSLKHTRRMSEARARLADEGMSLGL